jgi:hypothetical protein
VQLFIHKVIPVSKFKHVGWGITLSVIISPAEDFISLQIFHLNTQKIHQCSKLTHHMTFRVGSWWYNHNHKHVVHSSVGTFLGPVMSYAWPVWTWLQLCMTSLNLVTVKHGPVWTWLQLCMTQFEHGFVKLGTKVGQRTWEIYKCDLWAPTTLTFAETNP